MTLVLTLLAHGCPLQAMVVAFGFDARTVAALGIPAALKATPGGDETTLDDVFVHYAGGVVEEGGNYREITRTRRTARRLG